MKTLKEIRDKLFPETCKIEGFDQFADQIQKETVITVIEEIEKLIPTKDLYSKGKDISVERIIELREQILMAGLTELKKLCKTTT